MVNGEKITKVVGEMQGAFAKFSGILDDTTQMFLKFNQFTEGVQNALSGLDALTRAGLDLNTSMTDLSALTGVTGDGLRLIERSARDLAKTFGGSAAQAVESYKLILSQLGPDIAQVPEALAAMGESVATLSKTMGGDTTAAADVLTTAMNQFGVSMEDPSAAAVEMARMMNVMAAAAQAGSAELPAIKEALQQSGMAAAAAGVSFEETNAAIQVLDQRGRKASEGGVALRNVLTTLSQGRFLPQEVLVELEAANIDVNTLTDTTRTLADRLQALTPLMDDTALMTKLFGRENSNAAIALISGVDALREYTEAVTDTRSAEEQAAVVMQSRQEQMARVTAAIEDAKIRLYDLLGGLYPVLKTVGEVLVPVAQLIPLINLLTSGLGRAAAAVKVKTAAMRVATAVSGTYRAALAALTAATGSARIATIALQATLTLGLSLAIQAVITLIQRLTQRKREEREATEALSDADDSYAQTLVDAKSRMSVLIAELRSFSGSKDEEKAKVDELNSVYGDAFGTYQTVKDWYDVLIARSGDYVQMLVNEAKIRDMASRAAEASIKADSIKNEISSTPATVTRALPGGLGPSQTFEADNPALEDLNEQLTAQEELVKKYNTEMQALVEENARIKQGLSAPLPSSGTDTAGIDSGNISGGNGNNVQVWNKNANTLGSISDNLQLLRGQLQDATAEEAVLINRQIALWQAKADAIRNAGLTVEEGGTPTLDDNASTLEGIEDNIQILNEKLQTAGVGEAALINQQIALWQTKADAIRNAGIAADETVLIWKEDASTLADIGGNIQILTRQLQTATVEEAALINQQISAWDEKADAIRNAGLAAQEMSMTTGDALMQGWSGIKGIGNSIMSITSALEGNGNAWQAVVGIIDGFIGLYQGVQTVIDIVGTLTGVTNMLTAAKQAEAVAATTAATATVSGAAQEMAASTALATAKSAETTANVSAAASGALSAHSAIPFVGIALGLAAVAAIIAAMSSLPKFAKGGIAFGPTLGLFGEYPGASSNPEVVAPLDRLRSMLRPDDGTAGRVRFVIEGRDLVGIMDRMDRFNGRTR